MSELLGSDKAISNPERIMRLVGTRNNKPPAADCTIIEHDCTRRYTTDAFAVLKAPEEPETKRVQRPVPRITVGDAEVRAKAYAATWEPIAEGDGRNQQAYIHYKQIANDLDLGHEVGMQYVRWWDRKNNPPLPDWEL